MKPKHFWTKNLLAAAFTAAFAIPAFSAGIGSPEANASANQAQGQAQGQMQGQLQGQMQGQGQASFNRNTNHNSAFSASGAYQTGTIVNDTDIRPAASAPGFALTSVGTDNCLGSASASIGTGFFSIGGASTTESVECNRRAYARALRELGQTGAALQLLCLNSEVAGVTPACAKPAAPTASAAPAQVASIGGKSRDYDELVCKRTGERCQ